MDYYLDITKQYERLKQEYLKYGKLIIAYDFDDTVYDFHRKGRRYEDVINLLRKLREYAYFIVYTASEEERYEDIKAYLNGNGIPFDTINENIKHLNIPNGHKLYYNILLDDRAGLPSAYQTLYFTKEFILAHQINKCQENINKLLEEKCHILNKDELEN